ncbi:FtsQ-type POTRA domain-containing protein [Microbacterium sp. SS28]|uniref:FtsQ-type POTRA domain-containing protein n=1 Tax=Microbacterium sp. SS28 TaxID=2919948 RepID=UPI001FA9DBC3|nr:FtsQ-type POTRA domain-containing protein [Microbacterium sp. SS28]
MRRPTPLPPTARPAGGEAVEEPPVVHDDAPGAPDEVDAERRPVGPDGTEPALAPVIPLATAEDASEADETPEAPAPPVQLSDVWRAARARRKALRAEVRRFTVRQRRRRMLWLGAAASVLLLVLMTLAAAYSPLFGVERITVVGASLLDAQEVEAALSDQVGTPLPLVDESAVKAALIAFPLVQSYSLEARPPHELVVRIVERLPIGLVQSRAGYTLVDAAGVALSTTETPSAGTPLLTIAGGTDSPAFVAVGQVMRTLPASIRDQVTAISASTADDVTLTLGGVNCDVVWGSAEDSAMKALVLEKTMAQRPPSTVSAYDVSSPHAVVVR